MDGIFRMMVEAIDIVKFMERVRGDVRIGPLHISLYMAILYRWAEQGCTEAVEFTAKELMPVAKIAGGTPFYRCLRELHRYGYLEYRPSFNPAVKSKVLLGK
jgi:hypothetical protein